MTRQKKSNTISCIIDGCGRPRHLREYCRAHYSRWQKYRDPLAGRTYLGEPLAFLKNVVANPSNECVIWPFANEKGKYGRIGFRGKNYTAHRVALVLLTGVDPIDKEAAHGPCHNPLCVNPHPQHQMRWATISENSVDRVRDGTHNRGASHPLAKLTAKKVRAIRADTRPQQDIADDYEVCQGTVSRIKRRKQWNSLK